MEQRKGCNNSNDPNDECWYSNSCEEECPGSRMCNRYTNLHYQMTTSGLPTAKQKRIEMFITDENKADEKTYQKLNKIRENIDEFVQAGKNLYICSQNVGNGKTSWAIRMLHTYLALTADGSVDIPRGVFISVPSVLALGPNGDVSNPKARALMQEIDLVVWDDLAITGLTEYQYLQLYTLINDRVFAEKSNIFTSNVTTLEELQDIVGQRIASRTFGISEVYELVGADLR